MRKLVGIKDLRKVFGEKSVAGYLLAPPLMRLLKLHRINKLYDAICDYQGRECVEAALHELDVSYNVSSSELENIPKDGPFITVSNHAYGGLDGIMLMHLVTEERPDYKVLVNFLLSMIKPLKDFFLPVNAFGQGVTNKSSLTGIRMAKETLAANCGLGIFPAGEVSHTSKAGRVEDIPWDTAIVKFIWGAGVPIVPIYFDGHNSSWFLKKAKMHPMLQTASLPSELLNKRGQRVEIRIGSAISVAEQKDFENYQAFGAYLRARTYALAANIERGNKYAGLNQALPIAAPRPIELAQREIEQLPSKQCLFKMNKYAAYFATYSQIPNLMHEIGRQREESFRAVGEGTFQPLDLDNYDRTYHHLVLWDSEKGDLVGAYRIGMGGEIIPRFGVQGLYNNSLFDFSPEFVPILEQSMELGRAFISVNYRYETIPMMLLFKGLFHIMLRNPQYRYFVGPVSISSWFPKLYQSIIHRFISKFYSAPAFEGMVKPRSPFTPDFGLVDPDVLLRNAATPEQLDRLLLRVSNRQYRLPSLVKRYLKLNAKVITFNVDKDFNDSLDGFIVCDMFDVPKTELLAITKDLADPSVIDQRFGKRP